ncbi:C6 zinc finger domain-containing protein [Phlyctema vagabunda]|uniref:C6 zinc finger domain-containing protein n=1 Tax=Phlyctema vagabunda TaxID=108571 RepID=A0ABR4P8M8_9HELO
MELNEEILQSTQTVVPSSNSGKPRKKFDKPPVKLACLPCRASRTRCDGQSTCSNCLAKKKVCSYTQSRRGGARIRKPKVDAIIQNDFRAVSPNNSGMDMDYYDLLDLCQPVTENSLPQPYFLAQPGAGLNVQDSSSDDADFIFDTIFSKNFQSADSGYGSPEACKKLQRFNQNQSRVRTYGSDEDILNAYYVFIHPYFPVLPPPEPQQVVDKLQIGTGTSSGGREAFSEYIPCSPIALSLSATLALIPHPDDPDPSSSSSVLLRRGQAHSYARAAVEAIETESELLCSTTNPGDALSQEPALRTRKPFHAQGPLENESIIALLILGTYEYAQRGNISKLRTRAGQALIAAMELNLHSKGPEKTLYAEADRRAWWMTYILVCQGSILSNAAPTILLHDPRFVTPSPTFASDPGAWAAFFQAQQVIVSATQFVLDLEKSLKSKTNYSEIWERMLELEGIIEPLVMEADQWELESSPPADLDWFELKVSQALRGMAKIKLNSARIKLHRFCAFSNIPVFSKKHCDLEASEDGVSAHKVTQVCPCSGKFHQTVQAVIDMTINTPPSAYTTAMSSPTAKIDCGLLPFSSHFSAKVCMKSAFEIARSFQALPFPNPNSLVHPEFSSPGHRIPEVPRTMPIFACCAMQSSYAMVMLCYKTRALGFGGTAEGGEQSPAWKLMNQLSEGLKLILDALRNYSIAFEALGGMQDQIKMAAESVDLMHLNME